jgi:nicotinamide phosphoribosyltransferase
MQRPGPAPATLAPTQGNRKNLILDVDSYKASHYLQYPPGTTFVSSYIESRGGAFDMTLFFGLQMFLKEYLSQPISKQDIDEAEAILIAHGLPFNREGWEYILKEHKGFLPIEIQAVPEGTVIPTRNVLVQVINTDGKCAWLTSYVETALMRAVWYPTTVATVSKASRNVIARYLLETADNQDGLPFKLHDFGARGVSSEETAALGGAAHLVNFQGTDTISGILAARRYYGADMAGFSIPAAEHSTITAWGLPRESDAYKNMLEQFGGDGKLVAVVSDSYDLWRAVDSIWGEQLKAKVENFGGTLVIRPDSGDPVRVVIDVIDRLMNKFGSSVNDKDYRVLPPYLRVIQGDGISLQSIEDILSAMKAFKQSADNIAFGMGGALLQQVNRDTLKFAMKASAVKANGEWRDIFKAPSTDPQKISKAGRLALIHDDFNCYHTVAEKKLGDRPNELQIVFRNGKLLKDWTFDEVRERAQSQSVLHCDYPSPAQRTLRDPATSVVANGSHAVVNPQ